MLRILWVFLFGSLYVAPQIQSQTTRSAQNCRLVAISPLAALGTSSYFPLGSKMQVGCTKGYTVTYLKYKGVIASFVECTRANEVFDASNYARCDPSNCTFPNIPLPATQGNCPALLQHDGTCSLGCQAGYAVTPAGISTTAKCAFGSVSTPVFDCMIQEPAPTTAKPTASVASAMPTALPTTVRPTSLPTRLPTSSPSRHPSYFPSSMPSASPSPSNPTQALSAMPSRLPTSQPSSSPTLKPCVLPEPFPAGVANLSPLAPCGPGLPLQHGAVCNLKCLPGWVVSQTAVGEQMRYTCGHGLVTLVGVCTRTLKPTSVPTSTPTSMPTSPPTVSPAPTASKLPAPPSSPTTFDFTCTASLSGLTLADVPALAAHLFSNLNLNQHQQMRLHPVPTPMFNSAGTLTVELYLLSMPDKQSALGMIGLCKSQIFARAVEDFATKSQLMLTILATGSGRVTTSESCIVPNIEGGVWADLQNSNRSLVGVATARKCAVGAVLLPEEACELRAKDGLKCTAEGASVCLISGKMSVTSSQCQSDRHVISLVSGIIFLLLSPAVFFQTWSVLDSKYRKNIREVSNTVVLQHVCLASTTIARIFETLLGSNYMSSEWRISTGATYFLGVISSTALIISISLLVFIWFTVALMPGEQTGRPFKIFVLVNVLLAIVNTAFSLWVVYSTNQVTPRKVAALVIAVCDLVLAGIVALGGYRLYQTLTATNKSVQSSKKMSSSSEFPKLAKPIKSNMAKVARRTAIATYVLATFQVFTALIKLIIPFVDPYSGAVLQRLTPPFDAVPIMLLLYLQYETVKRLKKKSLRPRISSRVFSSRSSKKSVRSSRKSDDVELASLPM
mmetsp:Transcript_32661/g.63976  ORF Transcript_32661/g.63976 Transcript_32661/m.63976 type:complete len:845 (-) Transcript_32661:116-2650(-)